MAESDELRPELRYLRQRVIEKCSVAYPIGPLQSDAVNVLLDAIERILESGRTPAESDLERIRAFAKGQGKKERGGRHERMIAAVLAAEVRGFSLTHPKKLDADSQVETSFHAAAKELLHEGIVCTPEELANLFERRWGRECAARLRAAALHKTAVQEAAWARFNSKKTPS